ncbi:Norsolorinic acid reductase A [Paramyrothecium foliicola]|nr:Norsolorinic acid reductase A [Paramyrothecium foliicola]
MSINIALPMAAPAKTPLARYRLLSPTASLRVSPLAMGGMSFGDAWKDYKAATVGATDQKTVESILDHYFENGGNFIDTSSNYQFEQSEKWIGEWMAKRGNRDQMVIATKYTTNFHAGRGQCHVMPNFQGNGSKSMHISVKESLEKLQTSYIDILYVHWWDHSTSIPELMQSLNHLVASGKVLYLGISDSPAWVVSKANEYARNNGLRQFSIYQGRWNAADRDLERDVIPMCRAEGMAIAAWSALGSGKFKSEEQRKKAASEGRNPELTENDIAVSRALEAVAKRKNATITGIAQAYVMSKVPYVFPIIGGRTVEHLKGNIEALNIRMTDEDIKEIEDAAPFDPGFPHNFMYGPKIADNYQNVWLLGMGGTLDHVPEVKSISRE